MNKRTLKLSILITLTIIISLIIGYFLPHDDIPNVGKMIVEQGGQRAGYTLANIHRRDKLHCGVPEDLPGFASRDFSGQWHGFNIDFCRALASAILHDNQKVAFIPLTRADNFTALQSGKVDLLADNTSITIARDANLNLHFSDIIFYDGQGFLVPKRLKITSIYDAKNITACMVKGTVTQRRLIAFFKQHNVSYKSLIYDNVDDALGAYDNGRCDLYSIDHSTLAAKRTLLQAPIQHELLKELISNEPFSLVLREGDSSWNDIVNWTLNALILAETLQINSQNVEKMLSSNDVQIKRLLGQAGEFGKGLGLSERWAYYIIRDNGNYAEIFERNLGKQTQIGLERGLNALWYHGGLHYSLPMR